MNNIETLNALLKERDAQIARMQEELGQARRELLGWSKGVARLTSERDEAREIARKVPGLEFDLKAKANECEIADAEVARLAATLAAECKASSDHYARAAAAEQRVVELKAMNATQREDLHSVSVRLEAAEARVRELEELLDMAGTGKGAAESELAQLRERVAKALGFCRDYSLNAGVLADCVEDALRDQ